MIYDALMIVGLLVGLVLALLLWALAALHVYWGKGGLWPADDEVSLTRMVVGAPGANTMPSEGACYAVAAALFFAGLWPLMMFGPLPHLLPVELLVLAGYALALIFLARGAATYVPAFRAYFSEEPFATLDRERYGPLCLMIGTAFAFLLSLGWITP